MIPKLAPNTHLDFHVQLYRDLIDNRTNHRKRAETLRSVLPGTGIQILGTQLLVVLSIQWRKEVVVLSSWRLAKGRYGLIKYNELNRNFRRLTQLWWITTAINGTNRSSNQIVTSSAARFFLGCYWNQTSALVNRIFELRPCNNANTKKRSHIWTASHRSIIFCSGLYDDNFRHHHRIIKSPVKHCNRYTD